MKKYFGFILILILASSCTKDVPESEKELVKSSSEKEIKETINGFVTTFNAGEFEKLNTYFADDYSGFIPDSDNALNFEVYKNELKKLRGKYPDVKLQVNIEEVFVSEELASAQAFSSFMTNDPIEGKLSPAYSERSIRLLRKARDGGWKIFRSLSIPAFSY